MAEICHPTIKREEPIKTVPETAQKLAGGNLPSCFFCEIVWENRDLQRA
jgi:hypothetical protein